MGRVATGLCVLGAGLIAAACGNDADDRSAAIRVSPTSGLVTTEHEQTATFEVSLNSSDAPTADVVIRLSSDDESEGVASPDVLQFSPADYDTPQTVTITGVDDDIVDGHTRFSIELADTESDDVVWDGIDPADVDVTNFDDDGAAINVEVGEGFVSEDVTQTTVSVRLSVEPLGDVSLEVSSSDTTEATVDVSSLTFTPENFATAQVVTVTGVDDDEADGEQQFNVEIGAAVSIDLSFDGLDAPDPKLLNIDNDTPDVVVVARDGITTTHESGNPGQVDLDVRLSTIPQNGAVVPVTIVSSDPTEGIEQNGSLMFDASNWDQVQTVSIIAQDDQIQDGQVDYTVTVTVGANTDPDYNAKLVPSLLLTNLDDDLAGVSVTPGGPLTTTEGGGQDTFDVQLLTEPTADVVILLESSNPAEGVLDIQTLTFTNANWFTPRTVTITGQDDAVADNNVSYFIGAMMVSSSDSNYDQAAFPTVSVVNNDDDTVGITINPSGTELATSESGGSDSFTVVLNTEPTANVVIDVTSTAPAEATTSISSMTFTAADWDNPRTVTVLGVDDAIDDGEQVLNIVMTVSAGDPAYLGLTPESPLVRNADDDTAGVSVSPRRLDVSESDVFMEPMLPASFWSSMIMILFPNCADFEVNLNTEPTADVTIPLQSSDTGEFTMNRSQLTFSPLDYATKQKVRVCGKEDGLHDSTQTVFAQTKPATGTDASGYVGLDAPDVEVHVHDTTP